MNESISNKVGLDRRNRESSYRKLLRKDRSSDLFDGHMLELARKYVRDVKGLEVTRERLRAIGFTQSRYTYSHHEKNVHAFVKKNASFGIQKGQHFQNALNRVLRELGDGTAEALRYINVDPRDYLGRRNTHAGTDYLETGLKLKSEYSKDQVVEVLQREEQRIKEGKVDNYIMLGARTSGKMVFNPDGTEIPDRVQLHLDGEGCVTRTVSMFAMSKVLIENKFALPFSAKFFMNWQPYAGRYSDKDLDGRLLEVRRSKKFWTSIDYSQFDASIPKWLLKEVFYNVIKPKLVMDEAQSLEFDAVYSWFTDKYFMLADKDVFVTKGIPSGSRFTQIVGSLCNALMIYTYFYSIGMGDKVVIFVMGDDNIMFIDEQVNMMHLSSYIDYNFGCTIHPEKGSQGTSLDSPDFLSRLWTGNGAWRDFYTIVTKLLYPESFRDYAKSLFGKPINNPEEIFYAYILTFPVGMREFFDTDAFVYEHFRDSKQLIQGKRVVTGSQRAKQLADEVRRVALAM